ncbi:hypothetical protein E0Z10_g3795 [Xylaria hypoxylon]|uniref:RNA-dependent RNA polymerase n=1 Tax=Xylaria hypoxylon TaxID=37992 RepID=A0A4Z0YKY5_9PEZI|nr:hypothetical protein E0Z10_g3795 [Xylaria hypoxylon]
MAPNQRHGSRHASSPESDSTQPPVASSQQKPRSKRADDFDIWFLEFSNSYNLNLYRPNSSFLVDGTDARVSSYYDDSSFYPRLKTQFSEGNADIILRIFGKDAREIHSKWIKKPRGDRDATPSSTHLPRASTESERASLLDRLAEILDFLSPHEHRSKRPSVGGSSTSPSPKRSRAVVDPSRSPSVLTRLDSGEVRPSSPSPESTVPPVARNPRPSQQHDVYGLAPSVNTSRSSLVSRVFTEVGDPEGHSVFPATQETEVTAVAESSQQQSRRPSPSLVDSLAPSSSTERALEASFNERNNLEKNVTQLPRQNGNRNDSNSDASLRNLDTQDTTADDAILFEERLQGVGRNATASDPNNFKKRLQDVWPMFPAYFQSTPLAVRWEVIRVALHCGTPMEDLHFKYEPIMNDQNKLWESLRRLHAFQGKSFPEKSRPEAWSAAMSDHFRSADQVVVLTASLAINNSAKIGPLFKLNLQPLRLDLPHRLDRRFGSDRFLELIMPSPYTKEIKALSKGSESLVIDAIHNWLVEGPHFLLGRSWRSFGTKQATPKKIHKDDTLRPETRTILQERIYLFAENGNDFIRAGATQSVSPKLESTNAHTKMKREHLLNWLLQIQQTPKNQGQSVYKLFSRIALGLSRTHPTVILQPEQIRHCNADIMSPAKKVMNDGIARMSSALARQIRDVMRLDDIPAGYQGRFGSAKGFWIRDPEDTSDDIWIETYPSQRKWECDFKEEDHRTFEVRNASKELKSATLNLQLLPILEDRAINASDMKETVGNFMKDSLELEMKSQKEAMQDPARFRLWMHDNTASQRRQDRVRLGYVPWIAGLPDSREDQMGLLLSQGFDPTKLEFLRKIAYGLRKEKCDELQNRLNVKIGRSTYAYMTIDFCGILEEDEVHLGFSSKFIDEQSGFSETFLHGMDVLVARTPAHYPSDIQRVKAVFRPELGSLKDVIIFSSKGNIPLADKLSGGDYDGDIAWVCWEPGIVRNFTNAPLPQAPDLFKCNVLTKVTGTYESLARSCGSKDVTTQFINQAFRFNMEPSLLGACTNYKEKLCYSRNSVGDEHAIFLSTLISNLVDRAKQGIVFSEQDWNQQRRMLNSKQGDAQRARKQLDPLQPQYKADSWGRNEPPTHIIDYVKFVAGKPTVERELEKLNRYLGQGKHYDEDLVKFVEYFEKFKRTSDMRKKGEELGSSKRDTWKIVLDELHESVGAVAKYWGEYRGDFEPKVTDTYEKWRNIMPTDKVSSRAVRPLHEQGLAGVGLSQWDLLKASYCFRRYYNSSPSFPWYMAGYQLAYLKSIAVGQGRSAPPILMTPEMYAGVRPDAKFVRAVAALNDGRRYEQASEELEGVESLSDQDE